MESPAGWRMLPLVCGLLLLPLGVEAAQEGPAAGLCFLAGHRRQRLQLHQFGRRRSERDRWLGRAARDSDWNLHDSRDRFVNRHLPCGHRYADRGLRPAARIARGQTEWATGYTLSSGLFELL